ncbi:MAG: glycosyltransferase family 4 protein [Elusimicrobia bacterium]|nr:glycosyltransferase family 4 protein [Elusimicrobiota bacterium]
MGKQPRIAIVVPTLTEKGGVATVAKFLYKAINGSGRYCADIISLATAARDEASLRILAPASWLAGLKIISKKWEKGEYQHVGCNWAEFEFQRYRPRRVLTELLNKYDLVQVVAGGPALALAARYIKPPVCVFVATMVQEEYAAIIKRAKGWKKYWLITRVYLIARIEKIALKNVTRVFGESDYTLRLLTSLVERSRLRLGSPGVDLDVFHPEAYCQDGYILSVGRFLDPRKNIRMLFEAYECLRQKMRHAPKLMLAGLTGPSEEDLALAARLGIEKYIEIQQNVAEIDLGEIYRQASIFVLSSDEEGLGVVILEAMASGLPVISTRCGGPETAVLEGRNGFLTPVGDSRAMAEKMMELLSAPSLRRRMGEEGRRMAIERFSLPAAARAYFSEYEKLLGNK